MRKILFIIIISSSAIFSQNIEGMNGLFFIPNAGILEDSKLSFGINYLDKGIVSLGNFQKTAENYFISLNFLPFVEASIRITRLNGLPSKNTQAIGDRTPSIKIRVKEESKYFPSVAFGIHDIFTVFGGAEAVHNNALYGVVTKNINIDLFISNLSFTLGYGVDYLDAANHNFVGAFGGLSISVLDSVDFIVEYDSERTNGAIKAKLFDHISLLLGVFDFKNISGGVSYSFIL